MKTLLKILYYKDNSLLSYLEQKVNLIFLGALSSILIFSSCKKEKLDFVTSSEVDNITYSNVRIFNFGNFKKVTFNGDTLTYSGKNWILGNPPTRFFQEAGGLMGQFWQVPEELFQHEDNLELGLENMKGESLKFQLNKNVNAPLDYYTLLTEGQGQPWVVPISRDTAPPKKPGYIKIRLINLSKILPPLPKASMFGPLNNLSGPITLTYADGTPVSPETTSIDGNKRVSDYVEIPYGTYQFRVLTENGTQVPAGSHGVMRNPTYEFDPWNSAMVVKYNGMPYLSSNTYTPQKSFLPGGIYSIVLLPQYFKYPILIQNGFKESEIAVQNQFQILEDVPNKPNNNYFKIQGINAGIGEQIRIQANEKNLGGSLAYGKASDYQIIEIGGELEIQIKNSKGNLLSSKKISPKGNQNISLWIWRNKLDSIEITPVYNNLSQELYYPFGNDFGAFNQIEYTSYLGLRFLNFSPDESLINFVLNEGNNFLGRNFIVRELEYSKVNLFLEHGIPKIQNPYSIWDEAFAGTNDLSSFSFKVYRTKNSKIAPGNWISQVVDLSNEVFISNPSLYTRVSRSVPAYNSGIYSIALIGSTKDGTKIPAKLICIKHSK